MLKNWNLEYMKIEFKNPLEKAWKKKERSSVSEAYFCPQRKG